MNSSRTQYPRRARPAVAPPHARRLPLPLAIGLALAASALTPAQAATRTFSGASGALWGATTSWLGAIVPVNGDAAVLGFAGSPQTATFASVYAGVGLKSLSLDFGSTVNQSSVTSAMVAANEYIGFANAPASTYNQSGGSNTTTWLVVGGSGNTASGAYNLSGGTLNVGTAAALGAVDIGFYYGSTGAFNQTAGTTTVVGEFRLGYGDGGTTGSVALKGGSFNVSGRLTAGVHGSGTMTQSGGSASIGQLMLGYSPDPTGQGIYLLNSNNGVATLNSGDVQIGVGGGSSSFSQSGSTTHTVVGNVNVGKAGSYALGGGTLSAGAIQIAAGGVVTQSGGTLNLLNSADSSNAGSYAWTGGTLHFSGDASFAEGTLLRNSTTLSSGMTLAVDGMLNLSDASTLTLNGGQLQGGTVNLSGLATVGAGSTLSTATRLSNFGSLQLAGGTLSGPGILYNTAALTGYGRIDGTGGFTNSGLLTQSGGNLVLINTGNNANLGTWVGLAGRQLDIEGGGLSNQGLIQLNGGSVVGNAALINTPQGTVSGSGRIDSGFTNQGSLVIEAGLTQITASFVNQGQILLGANSATLSGGQIGNHGLIQGYGKINSNISNTDVKGVIEAQGGTLNLAGLIVSPNAGSLVANSGAKLLVTKGLASNAGQIQLAGGSFDNNGVAMVNSTAGVISGFGTLRSGTLTQKGQIQFSGGAAVPTSVYSSILANAGSKTILSGNSNATFYGAVDVQSGAELRVSTGSVATFFGLVQQRTGALFTGSGAKRFEGGLTVGASPGLGTDEGDVEFGDSNVYLAEIGGITACTLACGTNDAVKRSSFDKYIVVGQLSLGGTLKLVSWNGFVAQAGQQFDLLDWGTATGSFAAIDASGFTLAAGTALDVSQLYTTGTVSVSAVPEPGGWALLLAGLMGVGGIVKRRAGLRHGGAAPQVATLRQRPGMQG